MSALRAGASRAGSINPPIDDVRVCAAVIASDMVVFRALILAALWQSPGPASAPAETASMNQDDPAPCLTVRGVRDVKVIAANRVRMVTGDGRAWVLQVRDSCPDLAFHGYVTYVPVAGQLCAGRDELISREGYTCRISDIRPLERAGTSGPVIE